MNLKLACCVPTPGIDGGIIEDRHLALIARLGFKAVRQNGHVDNPNVVPMMTAIHAHGLVPFICLDFRTGRGKPEMTPANYGLQCFDLAKLASDVGIVPVFEIDNEPKIMGSIDPGVYAAFARAGFDAIRAGHPDAEVLIAGEIYEAPVNARRRLDRWFEKMIDRLGVDIYLGFDGLAIHTYTNDGGWPDASIFEDYRRIGCLLPLYVTEVGAKPAEPRGQAALVKQEVLNEEAAGIEWSCIYQLRADPDPRWDFGILNHDESPREVAVMLAELMGGTA